MILHIRRGHPCSCLHYAGNMHYMDCGLSAALFLDQRECGVLLHRRTWYSNNMLCIADSQCSPEISDGFFMISNYIQAKFTNLYITMISTFFIILLCDVCRLFEKLVWTSVDAESANFYLIASWGIWRRTQIVNKVWLMMHEMESQLAAPSLFALL
jgi:hypothetical protein